MARSKQKPQRHHLLLPLLLASVAASTPSSRRRKVDPLDVKFVKTLIPEHGVIKQYSSTDRESRRGKWHITLKHKPNLQSKKWGSNKAHLHRVSDDKPYETEKEAQREVIIHQMHLEGYERGEGDNSKEFFESPAMVSAREKDEATAMETSFTQALDEAAAANNGVSHAHAHSRTHHYPPIMYAYLTISSPPPIRVIIIIIEYFYFFD